MLNSSMIYLINENEVELAIPYQLNDNGELRETTWAANAYLGPDVGPDGTKYILVLKTL